MSRIRVEQVIAASPAVVWADVAQIEGHVEWMADAEAIRFTTEQRQGEGTRFDCDTRVGPFKMTDRMVVTTWTPERAMGIRHVGLVTGTGEFTLRELTDGSTLFVWEERLTFPWHLGGPVIAAAAAPVLAWIWRRNLRRLAARF